MDPSIVSALSAVLGSLVGGSATIATAWVTQRTQAKRALVRAEMRKREQLYAEFIVECSKLAVDALDHTLDQPGKLLQAYALENRIRLSSSDTVVAAADEAIQRILKQYFDPNMTPEELRDFALTVMKDPVKREDPLKRFSEACRVELREMQVAA
jgi:hypothetical protein